MNFSELKVGVMIEKSKNPDKIILEMFKAFSKLVNLFNFNMGFWKNRIQLGFNGRMPVSNALPNKWFDTPNIHLCTFSDFEKLCRDIDIKIIEKKVLNNNYSSNILLKSFPNFFW